MLLKVFVNHSSNSFFTAGGASPAADVEVSLSRETVRLSCRVGGGEVSPSGVALGVAFSLSSFPEVLLISILISYATSTLSFFQVINLIFSTQILIVIF
uniref:Uncharacterized protein LOC104223161 n=1 Tax=Nicotiana sylvestris TaxID=4096 RepID=A0A1U7W6K9_NICSY|nr:PREDICTED: uncharacterized protein LOC104223161 [Nicotiana sylvestris]